MKNARLESKGGRSEQRKITRKMPKGRPFAKGQSGNPGGRPKGVAAMVAALTHDGSEMLEFLVGVMRDKKAAERDRLKAVELLMDRRWGKPQQQVEVSGLEGGPIVIEEQLGDGS